MMTQARKSGDCTVLGEVSVAGYRKRCPVSFPKKEANLLERERYDTSKQRGLTPCTCPDEVGHRFRGNSEQTTGFRRDGWPTCVGISGRHRSEYAASNQDRPPTQQTERDVPSPDSLCERFHEELLWCFCEHRPRWVVMRLALPIEGEAMISLGAKSVRQARWMLSALDYGKVMDVSRLGKNSEGIQIRAIRK